jgi:Concanavalin A-like lectin/glucanases superfamily
MLATWGNQDNGLNAYLSRGRLVVGGWRIGYDNWAGTFLTTQGIKPGTWHHVAVVLDARPMVEYPQDGALRVYLDGQLTGQGPGMQLYGFKGGSVNLGFVGPSATSRAENGPLPPGGWTFDGMIDQVRLWNRALTDQEVRSEAGRSDTPRRPQ